MLNKICFRLGKAYLLIKWLAKKAKPFIVSIVIIVSLGAVLSLCGVIMAVVSKRIIDLAAGGDRLGAIQAAAAFAAIIVMQVGLQTVLPLVTVRTYETMSNTIRQNIFTHLTRVSWLDYSRYHSGDIITRMTSDLSAVLDGLIYTLADIITLTFQFAAAFLTLLYLEPALAIMAFVLAPVTVVFSYLFTRRIKQHHSNIQEVESQYRSYLQEAIQNMLVVKSFCLEDACAEQIGKLQSRRFHWVLRRNRLGALSGTMLSLGSWAGYFLGFVWGAMGISQGSITFGTMTAFLLLVEQVQVPLVGLAHTLPKIASTFASAERLVEFDRLENEEGYDRAASLKSAGVLLKDVSFGYDTSKLVLDGINAEIMPGQIVALVGTSGEGKTTIIRMLLALLKPDYGRVYITGGNGTVLEASRATRKLISYVPQGNTLFSGTIADNLCIGNIHASRGELEAALRAACAWEFVEELPEGINTVIGERGVGLSEGQAQRIAIARALLHKTPMLILDEATSALDLNTELRVLGEIRCMKPAPTCIIITHRHSALEICHRVLKLEAGRIHEIMHSQRATESANVNIM